MADTLVTFIMPGVFILAGLTMLWLAYASAAGKLRRNFWIGIRTQVLLHSDSAWRVGHRAAAGLIAIGSYGLFGAALLGVLIPRDFQWLASLIGAGWVIVFMMIASSRAETAVREQDGLV